MALLLGACGGGGSGGGALTAVKTWFEALSQLDLNKVTELTCESQKATVEQAFSFLSAGGETDLQAMKELFNIDVSGLTYEEKGVSGNTATVHIAGELKVSAFGQEQTQPVDEDVPVVNEGGTWKVCATEVPGS
jgi:hypothetical protein